MQDAHPHAPASAADDVCVRAIGDVLAVLELKDPIAAAHCRGASAWSRRIAKALELEPAAVAFVERAAALLDVGKLFTPQRILGKPAALSASEWDRMRDHPVEGAELLEAITVLRPFAWVVRAHHERPDGLGYPNGLREVDLGIEARIVGVADALDAMLSARAHRPALALDDALASLQSGAGRIFDARVVEATLGIVGFPRTSACAARRWA